MFLFCIFVLFVGTCNVVEHQWSKFQAIAYVIEAINSYSLTSLHFF